MTQHYEHELARSPEVAADRIECVYLTCFRPEFSCLAIVTQYSRVRMVQAESLDEADFVLTVTGARVLLTDVSFPDGSWREALYMAAEMHPHAASVIVADPVDRPYLGDAYMRGACGVLWKPIDFAEAIRLIRTVDQASRDRGIWLAETEAGACEGWKNTGRRHGS
jgi:DNA-binding NarL/FixJ family response regulator